MKSAALASKTEAAPASRVEGARPATTDSNLLRGEANDAFEPEGDRIANKVMARAPRLVWSLQNERGSSGTAQVRWGGSECSRCEDRISL